MVEDKTVDSVIVLIFIIAIIAFVGWIVYVAASSNFEKVTLSETSFLFTCLSGQCATDLESGFKTCPPLNDTTPLVIDPRVAVCNGRYVCDNPLTPFALLWDGSTSSSGICNTGVECPCMKTIQCPEYIVSIFSSNGGNAYDDLSGQRISFPQVASYVDSKGVTQNGPFVLNNLGREFCFAPLNWLAISSPGCGMFGDNVTYDNLVYCMGGAIGCSGLNNNPCKEGTLAIIANDSEDITSEEIPSSIVGCVRGTPCPCGQIAIFDKNFGGIVCRDLSKVSS